MQRPVVPDVAFEAEMEARGEIALQPRFARAIAAGKKIQRRD